VRHLSRGLCSRAAEVVALVQLKVTTAGQSAAGGLPDYPADGLPGAA
jgi:hypothetical protein